jgi:hypothetical protein
MEGGSIEDCGETMCAGKWGIEIRVFKTIMVALSS